MGVCVRARVCVCVWCESVVSPYVVRGTETVLEWDN